MSIVFPSVPFATFAVTSSVRYPPSFNVPTLHVPVEVAYAEFAYVPIEGLAETKVSPVGTMPVAVMVVDAVSEYAAFNSYVIVSPTWGFESLKLPTPIPVPIPQLALPKAGEAEAVVIGLFELGLPEVEVDVSA